MSRELHHLVAKWKNWASSSDKSEDGWESDFPNWAELIAAATESMVDCTCDEKYSDIEACWSISSETEDLAEFARDNVAECWPVLRKLTESEQPTVRWQAYSVLPLGPKEEAEIFLRRGLLDSDAYCRKRALVAIESLQLPDFQNLCRRLASDCSEDVRDAAFRLSDAATQHRP